MQSLQGRRALITGGASGLGLATAMELARRGAQVTVLDRDVAAGERVVTLLRDANPAACEPRFVAVDLGDADAIHRFAASIVRDELSLDLLINNAGLLPPLRRATTRGGHELGFGVTVVGHFMLTGLLLPALLRSTTPRVVGVSSIAHADGRLDFDDLQMTRGYDATRAYANTKLASLMFALELQRRSQAVGSTLISVAAHPGISRTNIGAGWQRETSPTLRDRIAKFALNTVMRTFGQSAEAGAQPLIHAAAAPDLVGGEFIGPRGFREFSGPPGSVRPKAQALDAIAAGRLWSHLEAMSGVHFKWPALVSGTNKKMKAA